MKLIILGILFGVCGAGCTTTRESRGEELCQLIKETKALEQERIDSLMQLSAGLPDAERYAVLYHGLMKQQGLRDSGLIVHYMELLGKIPQPRVTDKSTALLLLGCYRADKIICNERIYYYKELTDWAYQPEWIASLLFELEQRWKLSPQEQLRFLVYKCEIYFNVFKENKSVQLILEKSFRLIEQYGADPELLRRYYTTLNQSAFLLEKKDWIALIEKFLKFTDGDSVVVWSMNYMIGYLYVQDKDYRKAYSYLSRLGLDTLSHNVVVPVYLGLDCLPQTLTFLEQKSKENPHPLHLASLAWYEAHVREKMGDSAGYERYLRRSLEVYDLYPIVREENYCAVSEEYARLLWQQGRREKAIRRMEFATAKLLAMAK